MNVHAIAASLLTSGPIWSVASCPFKAHLAAGHPQLMVVVGDNGAGKSLFVESLRTWGRKSESVEATISISIRERVGAGSDFGGMRKQMVFGTESEQSTGSCSVSVTGRAFNNLDTWSEGGREILMVLDEPELGLSPVFSAPMGELIATRTLELKSATAGVVIVTHSRRLVHNLIQTFGAVPSFACLGLHAVTLDEWLADDTSRSLDELLQLPEVCNAHRRQVQDLKQAL